MFTKKQPLPIDANGAVAVISDDMTAVKQPKKAIKKAAKKAAKHKKERMGGDRVAQIVTVLATIMAAAYIIVRIINWIRFI
jgi:hypothetical protein